MDAAPLILGVGTWLLAQGFAWPVPSWLAGIAVGALLWNPAVGLLTALALWLLGRAKASRHTRQGRDAAVAELPTFGRLVGLALRSGSPPTRAVADAGALLRTDLGAEVGQIMRRAQHEGLGPALTGAAEAAIGGHLYRLMSRSILTGGPLADGMAAATQELEREQMAQRLAQARRLPVRLMLPLALLILPGFVLMALGPVIDQALRQFGF